jgi:hypothetical protein
MKIKAVFLLTGLLAALFGAVSAQSPNIMPTPQKVMSEREREQRPRSPAERLGENRRHGNESGHQPNFLKREALPFKASLKKQQRLRLAPDQRLAGQYADFLSQPGTGLIKLYSDMGCEENSYVLRVDAGCLDWIPNSAFYSFREKEHTTDYLSDLTYKNGFFVTDGILSQGLLAVIGDVPLAGVSLSTGGIKFLTDYQPPVHAREAFRQFIEIGRGLKAGGYEYRKAVRAMENMTYALRVIAYRGKFFSAHRGRVFDALYGDERTDIILAFRVLEKNEDGSVTLLWKEINRQKSPKIIFPKREKKANRPRLRGRAG